MHVSINPLGSQYPLYIHDISNKHISQKGVDRNAHTETYKMKRYSHQLWHFLSKHSLSLSLIHMYIHTHVNKYVYAGMLGAAYIPYTLQWSSSRSSRSRARNWSWTWSHRAVVWIRCRIIVCSWCFSWGSNRSGLISLCRRANGWSWGRLRSGHRISGTSRVSVWTIRWWSLCSNWIRGGGLQHIGMRRLGARRSTLTIQHKVSRIQNGCLLQKRHRLLTCAQTREGDEAIGERQWIVFIYRKRQRERE